jgi:hypothetical protein
MTSDQFDDLSRLAGERSSRRAVLKGLVATVLAAVFGRFGAGGAGAQTRCIPENRVCPSTSRCCPTGRNGQQLICRNSTLGGKRCQPPSQPGGFCVVNADCASGLSCCNGVCCPAGHTCCDGICRNLNTDPNNCGACGVVCEGGVCYGGTCDICAGSNLCATLEPTLCNESEFCFCLTTVEGNGMCVTFQAQCGPSCSTSADCNNGQCIQNPSGACCGGGTFCLSNQYLCPRGYDPGPAALGVAATTPKILTR